MPPAGRQIGNPRQIQQGVTSPSMACTTSNEGARRFEAGTNGAASAYKHVCGKVGPVGVGQNSTRRLIRAPQGPIREDALVRPLAIAALGALHRARAVLPTPQGCDRCSRIRKLGMRAARLQSCAFLRSSCTCATINIPYTKRPECRLSEHQAERTSHGAAAATQSPIRSPGSAPGIL